MASPDYITGESAVVLRRGQQRVATFYDLPGIPPFSERIDVLADIDLSISQKQTVAALTKAGTAMKDAAVARKETETLRRDNLLLKERIEDRRLSSDQISRLRDRMKGFAAPQAWQVIVFSNDGEARGLVVDIEQALVGANGAGWPVPGSSLDQTSMPIKGVLVEYSRNADTAIRSSAGAMVEMFHLSRIKEVGEPKVFAPLPMMDLGGGVRTAFTLGGRADPNVPITLIVGRKP